MNVAESTDLDLFSDFAGELLLENGSPMEVEPFQRKMLSDYFAGCTESVILLPKKNGKALALDTPVPTPDGWTTMGDLHVGDTVFDEQGLPCRVTFATQVMSGHRCYRVKFSDRTSVVADADHNWLTRAMMTGCYETAVRTTDEIRRTLRRRSDNAANHSVEVAAPLECEPADLPIDPYVLGYWLGDGTTGKPQITVGDQDVEQTCAQLRTHFDLRVRRFQRNTGTANTITLWERTGRRRTAMYRLRGAGVLDHKHVPATYLRASKLQRLALLQGLMDSDGSISPRGQCEYSTKLPELSTNVLELLRSLGFKPAVKANVPQAGLGKGRTYYRITFNAGANLPVFRLRRKARRQEKLPLPARRARSLSRQIVAVEPVDSVPVRCIQVDSLSHLFLAGEGMVPTHNTSLVAALSLFHLLTTPDAECVIGASSRDQATILFNQAAGLIRRSGLDAKTTPGAPFEIKTGFREIRSTTDSGRIRVLAADANTADGVIPTLAIVDELHRHRNADLYAVFRDGLGPRNGQIVTISTAGSDLATPLGVMRKKAYDLAHQEREGRAYRYCRGDNGQFCLHEWAIEARDDPDDMVLVKEANPASWQTIERLQARHDSPTTMSWQWLRFACGVWVRGFETWIPRWRWDERSFTQGGAENHACNAEGHIPRKKDVVLAFDGSFNGDSTGLVAVSVPKALDVDEDAANDDEFPMYDGPPPHIEVVECWERPEDAPEDWTVPVLEVEEAIKAACKIWRVREIACDPARWQRSFEVLKKRKLPVVAYPQQGTRMVPATTRFHTAVLRAENGLTHSGDERLARHVENAVLKVTDAGGQIAKASKTSPLKIDLAVCAIMAFDRAHYFLRKGSRVIDLNEVYQEIYGATPVMETAAELAEETSNLAAVGSVGPQTLVVAYAGDPEFLASELPRWGQAELVRDVGGTEPVDYEGSVLVQVHQGSPALIAQLIARRGYGRVLGALNK